MNDEIASSINDIIIEHLNRMLREVHSKYGGNATEIANSLILHIIIPRVLDESGPVGLLTILSATNSKVHEWAINYMTDLEAKKSTKH